MIHYDKFNLDRLESGPEYCQRLFDVAYSRLSQLPIAADDCKVATVASFGPYKVQLLLACFSSPIAIPRLWIEIHNTVSGSILDSAGCWDKHQARVVAEEFIAEAHRRSGLGD